MLELCLTTVADSADGKMINLYSAGLLRRSYLLLHPGALRAKHFLRVVVPLARGSCQLNGLEPTCRDSMFQQVHRTHLFRTVRSSP
eukprot:SAG31_NODE_2013_length_6665_cov_2.751295_7_plen_86_part_00